jgi:peptide chain release factor 1
MRRAAQYRSACSRVSHSHAIHARRFQLTIKAVGEQVVTPELDPFTAYLRPISAPLNEALGVGIPLCATLLVAGRLVALSEFASPRLVDAGLIHFRQLATTWGPFASTMEPRISAMLDSQALLDSSDGQDPEVAALAQDDISDQSAQIAAHRDDAKAVLRHLIIGAEPAIARETSWILEVSGRAGGKEASLFADELFEAYRSYADIRGWRFRDSTEEGDAGGKVAYIEGADVFPFMMHELGAHRVQRVPVTEAAGRMQTSTAAVTMLPERAQPTVSVREEDCDVEMSRGSGPGGQGVNSSSNCVNLKHRPSGIVVRCHESRSASENMTRALQKVAQRLWKEELKKSASASQSILASQWVSGERGDRIRTYNFPQARITDHRTRAWTGNRLPEFMSTALGLEALHEELQAIHAAKQAPLAANAVIGDMVSSCRPLIREYAKVLGEDPADTVGFVTRRSAADRVSQFTDPQVISKLL